MEIEINKYEQPMDRLNGSNFRTSILTIDGDLAHLKSTKRAQFKLYLFILMCSSLFYFFYCSFNVYSPCSNSIA